MNCKRAFYIALWIVLSLPVSAQRLITYEAGMGSRDPDDVDTWILYRRVKAQHEGMTLWADSALLNTRTNEFTAFRRIRIDLSDTTHIYGSRLYYDGNLRTAYIWGDTVRLVDGKTRLFSDRLTYDRGANTAYYDTWGHTVNGRDTLDSRQGLYDTDQKVFLISDQVRLRDSASLLLTDALVFNTQTNVASFSSPTHIYSDTSYLYSELGDYNTDIEFARSFRASFARSGAKSIACDTLFYNNQFQQGQAWGHVVVRDSANDLTCTGRYGETDQEQRSSFVTDSALLIYVDQGDTLFLRADTLRAVNDSADALASLSAHHAVSLYRSDAQARCDSLFYSAADSTIRLFRDPILWYDSLQCQADTITIIHDSAGARLAYLSGSMLAAERVTPSRFHQVKGRRCVVHFADGEPTWADVLGNAQMVYHLTERQGDSVDALIGVNVGIGTDMRIYLRNRQADRVTTMGHPEMTCYPPTQVPEDQRLLPGFEWRGAQRPTHPLRPAEAEAPLPLPTAPLPQGARLPATRRTLSLPSVPLD